MKETFWTLATLASHWRRHPANFGALLVGLAIATALWSGVQALNQQARDSYDRAAMIFANGGATSLISTRGGLFPQELYIKLRLAGWKASPVLEGTLRVGEKPLHLIGVEPLTLPKQTQLGRLSDRMGDKSFFTAKSETILAQETLQELKLTENAPLVADNGKTLPPLKASAQAPPGSLIVDIGVAQSLLDQSGKLSRLLMVGQGNGASLAALVGDELRLVEPEEESDLSRLTDSFHLNLTAFALLAYLVGLFTVHASYGLAFEQRLSIVRTMRSVGVSLRALVAAMMCELTLLALIAGGAGLICGRLIAAALFPNLSASLEDLYGAQLADGLTLDARWWVSGLGMAMLGALIAAGGGLYKIIRLPILSGGGPFAWRQLQEKYLRWRGLLAAAAFAASFAAYVFGSGLNAGFAVVAGLLFGAAFLLPLLLAALLRLGERASGSAMAQWFWADSRQQLSGLSLALMALLLALSTNIGVGGMVEGFRRTFVQWLDERLVAEVYLEAANAFDARRIEAWLEKRSDVTAILPSIRTKARIAGWPVEVVGLRPQETYRKHFQMLSSAENAWDVVQSGEGALVSEQLARRLGLTLGSSLNIPIGGDIWRAKVVGVYPDYGNAKGQLRVDLDALARRSPGTQPTTYSLRTPPDHAPQLIAALQDEFGRDISRIVDQSSLKKLSTGVFERTFAVTAALNALTLLVAAIALFASLLTLSNLRLAQIAPIWAIGVPRWRVSQLEFVRILFFATATAAAAVPLGLALSWCLVAIVNVEAFGWRLPFHFFPEQWTQVFAMAVVTALAAGIAPILRLARATPADLLRVFANER